MNKIKEFIKNTPTSVLTAISFLAIMLTVFTIMHPGVMFFITATLGLFAAFMRIAFFVIEKK